MDLHNKLFLITGASADSDIGLAICKQLDKAGAKLILVGRREALLQETQAKLHNEHYIAPFDLSYLDDILPWVTSLVKDYGPLDGLVHSASFQGYSPLRTITPTHIDHYFSINCSAALMLSAALAKVKHHNPHASMVFVGSIAGFRGVKARTLYAASKAALFSITQSLALELADKTIRVNYVAPGVVSGAKAEQQFAMIGEAQTQALKKDHPLGLSEPSDVANSIHFLLSDMSTHITGTHILVDGGYLAK
jgi:NAD(P)-dependent dehydrogenase (short-subunit alcohol dehydrogenase family)